MKRLLAPLAAAAALMCFASSGHATITISAEYATIFQDNGSPIQSGRIGLLVADLGAIPGIVDPFGTTLTTGNFLGGGSDDLIIGTFQSLSNVANTGGSGFQIQLSGITYGGDFGAGDKLYLLWFPTLTTIGSTVSSGVSYGVYRSDVPNVASGATAVTGGFIAPADGSFINMSAYIGSIAPGSPVTQADFTANLTTVPEPSAVALFGVAALSMTLFRRRRARA